MSRHSPPRPRAPVSMWRRSIAWAAEFLTTPAPARALALIVLALIVLAASLAAPWLPAQGSEGGGRLRRELMRLVSTGSVGVWM